MFLIETKIWEYMAIPVHILNILIWGVGMYLREEKFCFIAIKTHQQYRLNFYVYVVLFVKLLQRLSNTHASLFLM